MHTERWSKFDGDAQAEADYHADVEATRQLQDDLDRQRAILEGRYTPLFDTPHVILPVISLYDQDLEEDGSNQPIELPTVADLAAHRAKKLLEANPGTDQEDRSDIA